MEKLYNWLIEKIIDALHIAEVYLSREIEENNEFTN